MALPIKTNDVIIFRTKKGIRFGRVNCYDEDTSPTVYVDRIHTSQLRRINTRFGGLAVPESHIVDVISIPIDELTF